VELDDFELSKLAAVANYRSQPLKILDNLLHADSWTQAIKPRVPVYFV
jgi:hypothetical protein